MDSDFTQTQRLSSLERMPSAEPAGAAFLISVANYSQLDSGSHATMLLKKSLYAGGRPGSLAKALNNFWAKLHAWGIAPITLLLWKSLVGNLVKSLPFRW